MSFFCCHGDLIACSCCASDAGCHGVIDACCHGNNAADFCTDFV